MIKYRRDVRITMLAFELPARFTVVLDSDRLVIVSTGLVGGTAMTAWYFGRVVIRFDFDDLDFRHASSFFIILQVATNQ